MKKKLLTIIAGIGSSIPTFASQVFAYYEWKGFIPRTDFPTYNLRELIKMIIQYLLIFAAVVAIFYAILGGYQYITAGGDADKATAGRTTLMNAIIGLVIIFAAYAIINYLFIIFY